MSMKERITVKLTQGLNPLALDIVDESDRHKGHAGAREGGETHYRVSVVSESSRSSRSGSQPNRCWISPLRAEPLLPRTRLANSVCVPYLVDGTATARR